MTSTTTGRRAEQAAADYLKRKKYKIVDQNWRTRWCEIDIVAQKDKTIYFVEVKYRLQNAQGNGLDYVTKRKLEQMRFAADMWVHDNSWSADYCLAAVEVSGPTFIITGFLTEL